MARLLREALRAPAPAAEGRASLPTARVPPPALPWAAGLPQDAEDGAGRKELDTWLQLGWTTLQPVRPGAVPNCALLCRGVAAGTRLPARLAGGRGALGRMGLGLTPCFVREGA